MEKVTKNVLTIISKPHAHPHTMKKTHAKFQNNRYKTVRGVALTRGTHCLYIEVKNDLVHNVEPELRQAGHYTPVASNKM